MPAPDEQPAAAPQSTLVQALRDAIATAPPDTSPLAEMRRGFIAALDAKVAERYEQLRQRPA